jgi:hypothetical protein
MSTLFEEVASPIILALVVVTLVVVTTTRTHHDKYHHKMDKTSKVELGVYGKSDTYSIFRKYKEECKREHGAQYISLYMDCASEHMKEYLNEQDKGSR